MWLELILSSAIGAIAGILIIEFLKHWRAPLSSVPFASLARW